MTETQFRRELRRSQTMQRIQSDPGQGAYWRGIERGLRRAYHGAGFGTSDEHSRFLNAIASPDAERAAIGRGYHDGLTGGGLASP